MFSKIFVVLAILVFAHAAVRPAKLEDSANPGYSYAYDVQDTVTGDSKNHLENKNGNVVTGQYSLNDPDGTRRTVQYTADDINGFVAFVRKEPLVQGQYVAVPQQQAALIQQQPAVIQQQPAVFQQQQQQQQQQQPAVFQQQPAVFQQPQPAVFQQQPAVIQQQPAAAIQEPVSFFQQPISLVQERIYLTQPVVQQQQQQQQRQAYVIQPARVSQLQPSRLAQKPKSQRQVAPQEETTTINSDSEDVEPTTTEPIAPNSGYYYPKPANPAALFAKKEPKKAPTPQDNKSEKLESFLDEPQAESVMPIAAPKTVQPLVAVEQFARVSTPFVQGPYVAISSPYTFSAVQLF